jgi:hypothetical protein
MDNEDTIYEVIENASRNGNLILIIDLLKQNNINWYPKIANEAALFNHIHIIKYAINNKLDINPCILNISIENNYIKLFKYIYENYSHPNYTKCNISLLQDSACWGNYKIFIYIYNKCKQEIRLNNTFIEYAKEGGNKKLIDYLLKEINLNSSSRTN